MRASTCDGTEVDVACTGVIEIKGTFHEINGFTYPPSINRSMALNNAGMNVM